MFKRFIKAVKDAAKRVWEFIKKLLPKPKEEPQPEPEEVPEETPPEPVEPEPVEPEEVEPVEEDYYEEDPWEEEAITNGDTELLEFCYAFRKLAKDSGNKVIFSYRGLGAIAKLKYTMPLEDILKICLVKGMDKDDLQLMQKGLSNMLPGNSYNETFCNISC